MLEVYQHPPLKPQRYAALGWASLAVFAAAVVSASAEEAGRAQTDAKRVEASARSEFAPAMTLETFLDRLMMAESGGDDAARNPLSTAAGPFQLIRETFLDIVERHFAEETMSLSTAALLKLREDRSFARKAAAAYSKDNAAHLAREGLPSTFTNLRLAYLTGPSGAVRVLRARPQTRVSKLLSPAAVIANPFMAQMTAQELIAKCARDLEVDPASRAGVAVDSSPDARPGRPKFAVKCSQALPSCRRWIVLRAAQIDRSLSRGKRSPVHSAKK